MQPPRRLGAGLSFQPALAEFALERASSFDFLEIVPDVLWDVSGEPNDEAAQFLGHVRHPMVLHSIGLSIGSADTFDTAHVANIARWCEALNPPWHSDHLSFVKLDEVNTGLTMPVPYDDEVLDLIVERTRQVQRDTGRLFALENNVHYWTTPGQDMDEPTFLNRLAHRADCGLLLDLHNVYCNARNHGIDPRAFIDALDLDRVVELHLAGGSEVGGMYLDAHDSLTPEPVWDLLRYTLPRTPNVAGVVFEVFNTNIGESAGEVAFDELEEELGRVRNAGRF
jgi:hypothetical protein